MLRSFPSAPQASRPSAIRTNSFFSFSYCCLFCLVMTPLPSSPPSAFPEPKIANTWSCSRSNSTMACLSFWWYRQVETDLKKYSKYARRSVLSMRPEEKSFPMAPCLTENPMRTEKVLDETKTPSRSLASVTSLTTSSISFVQWHLARR